MKKINALILKYLSFFVFVYGFENVILISKPKNIIANAQNNAFVIYVVFKIIRSLYYKNIFYSI